MKKVRIVIPARLSSTRLPGKPLLMIGDKPMIQHVYERALCCRADSAIIAIDDPKIAKVLDTFNASYLMTSRSHTSGTDRIAEVVQRCNYANDDIVINIQADEPFIPIENVNQVATLLQDKDIASMATICEPITSIDHLYDENCVKVVFDKNKYAIYFSRAPIPWKRGGHKQQEIDHNIAFRHIGLYAYKAGFLKNYEKLAKSSLENIESLEQLNAIWHGYKIAIDIACKATPVGVDTQSDLDIARSIYDLASR